MVQGPAATGCICPIDPKRKAVLEASCMFMFFFNMSDLLLRETKDSKDTAAVRIDYASMRVQETEKLGTGTGLDPFFSTSQRAWTFLAGPC